MITTWPIPVREPSRFDRESHTYFAGGVAVPSVTQCLQMLRDFGSVPAEMLRAASERGRLVHALTARDDTGLGVPWPEHLLGYRAAWQACRQEFGGDLVLVEQRVSGRGYAGTLDRLIHRPRSARRGAPWHLVDIKTTHDLSPVDALQTALYLDALYAGAAPSARPPVRRWTARLRADGTYQMHEWIDPADTAHALACVTVTRWRMEHERGSR